jgi:hypothetical protein
MGSAKATIPPVQIPSFRRCPMRDCRRQHRHREENSQTAVRVRDLHNRRSARSRIVRCRFLHSQVSMLHQNHSQLPVSRQTGQVPVSGLHFSGNGVYRELTRHWRDSIFHARFPWSTVPRTGGPTPIVKPLNSVKRGIAVVSSLVIVVVVSCLAVFAIRTQQIPSKVTAEEYAIYSAWTNRYLSKNPTDNLYILNRTFMFDPLQPPQCGKALHEQTGVSWSLMKPLSELGDAEFVLNLYSPDNLQIRQNYKAVESAPDLMPGTFHLLSFSRIAFNREHSQALFAISDACAGGDCGKGGAVLAQKKGNSWTFQGTACVWLY